VSEKEALQSAADEARKAARAARETAALLDNYAKYINQTNLRSQADNLRLAAVGKVNAIAEGMAASYQWLVLSDQTAPTQPLDARVEKQADEAPSAPEESRRSVGSATKVGKKGISSEVKDKQVIARNRLQR
jgi:2-phospho-L-lactate transferase/gluconeogenesis factor (CofD/UPF0052 family)